LDERLSLAVFLVHKKGGSLSAPPYLKPAKLVVKTRLLQPGFSRPSVVNADAHAHTTVRLVTVGKIVVVVIVAVVVVVIMMFRRYDNYRAAANLIRRRHTGAG
jgi:hypothetical protein